MGKSLRKPAYLLHKATGQARVRIAGKDHYLGEYNSAISRARYEKLVGEWFRNQRTVSPIVSGELLTIDVLCMDYLEHAKGYYQTPDGAVTSELGSLRSALKPLVQEFGETLASDFGPLALKRVRERMIDKGHCRTSVNAMVHRIRRMFAWAVENELIDVSVHETLQRVPGLRAGRTRAKESERVLPVSVATVNATLPHLPQVVADMVRLQLATGARPGEICQLRPQDVDQSIQPWLCPAPHETGIHGLGC